ncbi:hypothetical protein AB0I45_12530 [Brevibacterium sp. NPDC049920]|uniref:Uncharacterized protein n=1 Tax=Brevibacterium pityocampae TaxID=506594 RepID=A0ABP8J2F8_9MICO
MSTPPPPPGRPPHWNGTPSYDGAAPYDDGARSAGGPHPGAPHHPRAPILPGPPVGPSTMPRRGKPVGLIIGLALGAGVLVLALVAGVIWFGFGATIGDEPVAGPTAESSSASDPAAASAPPTEAPVPPPDPGEEEAPERPDYGPSLIDVAAADEQDARDWADANYGTFEPQTVSGSGPDHFDVPADVTGPAVVTYEIMSEGTFQMVEADESGRQGWLLGADGTGTSDTYIGGVSVDWSTITVTGDADWEIRFEPIGDMMLVPESGFGSGHFLHAGPGGVFELAVNSDEPYFDACIVEEITGDLGEGTELGRTQDTEVPSQLDEMRSGPSIIGITCQENWEFIGT